MNNMYKDLLVPFISLVLSLIAFITFHHFFFYFIAATSIIILLILAILYADLQLYKEELDNLRKLSNE